MNKRPALLFAAAAALPLGCTVGPDYHPPETTVPEKWVGAPAEGAASPAARWWQAFHDPELDSLIGRALGTNYDLRAASARVRQARAQRGVTAAGLWPTLNVGVGYQRERFSQNSNIPFPPGVPLESNVYQTGFDAAWELDIFGGQRRAIEAADAGIAEAEHSRRGVLVSLLGEVARNYVEARGFQHRLAITRKNIGTQKEVLELTRNLFKVGLATDLDIQQATTLLSTTEAQIPTLEIGFQQGAYALAVLCGLSLGALLAELSAESPVPSTPPEVPVGLPSELLLRRPDIRMSERRLAAATANIGVATADLYPKFSLTGSVGLQSIATGTWFTSPSRFWSVGPTVQWQIFDAGRIRANIQVQNARQEEALAAYEQTVLSAMRDVESALIAYGKEHTRKDSLGRAVASSREALALSQQLYQNGLVDFLRVLDAQRSVYLNEEALAISDIALAVDLIVIYKSLGGGWEEIDLESKK